jgi:hypothetical protein
MANELEVSLSFTYEKGLVKEERSISRQKIDVAGKLVRAGVQNVGTSEEALDLGGVSSGGYCFLRNLSETSGNTIMVRQSSADDDLIRLDPGEFAFFRLEASAPYVIAATEAADMEIVLLSA